MRTPTRRQWLVPTGLIALSLIPVVAGAVRLGQLTAGAVVTEDNARFFETPLPVVVHIVGATVFCVLGAFQFVPSLRRHGWHRRAGRVLVPFGLAAALSGMWMAVFYDLPARDNGLLMVFRMVFGTLMVSSLLVGLQAIMRRDVPGHRLWMMRGYALGAAAGTQSLLLLPVTMAFGPLAPMPNALAMGMGWVVNLAVVEWIVRRHPTAASSERSMRSAADSLR